MTWQAFWQVAVLIAVILGAQALFVRWLLRPEKPAPTTAAPIPAVHYIDRPLCAVDRTPITERDPLTVQMIVDLMGGVSLPVTIYICQHCVQASIPLIAEPG